MVFAEVGKREQKWVEIEKFDMGKIGMEMNCIDGNWNGNKDHGNEREQEQPMRSPAHLYYAHLFRRWLTEMVYQVGSPMLTARQMAIK